MEPMTTGTAAATGSSKLILSIIGLLVIVGIGYAVVRNNGAESDTATTTEEGTMEEGTFSGDIFGLVKRGGDWKCTWSGEQQGAEVAGTVYVSRGKFKSSTEMNVNGITVTAHAIGDGEFVYAWSSMMPTGFKFAMEQGARGVAAGTNAQAAQFAESYNYDCDPWRADSGEFALPKGITFTEMPMMQQ